MLPLALLALAASPLPGPPPKPGPEFFAAHRQRVIERLPAGAVAVFRSAPETSVETTPDPYRQDSTFWWLTGFGEPNSVAVLRKDAAAGPRYVLFVPPRDPAAEQWTGWRAGAEGARKDHRADEAFTNDELWKKLPELWAGARALVVSDGGDAAFRAKLVEAWAPGDPNATEVRPVVDAAPIVGQLRLVKDAAEVALLRHAARLSAEAHVAAMRVTRPGAHEYTLKGAMVGTCLSGGAARMAYPPIVGGGRNSVILHYEPADAPLEPGAMIVNDTACEYGMYAADVTRSYPVSGRFSPEQRAIYDIVLQAQKAGFAKVRPGAAFRDVHQATAEVVVDGLLKLGLLAGDRGEVLEKRAYQKLYPHGSSHWIGMNVHDVGSYGYPEGVDRLERYGKAMTRLEPGMLLTVEPGIYVPEAPAVDRKWWNLGVRIEDVVLVTADGMECLSCSAPREVPDVEKEIAARGR
ncbi:MAG TPA: aminopeptidase P family protein [Vicinamibacteria bacterium]|nr:aminopeptidase P family protein [Vicinamibacteria bacterium]